MRRTTKRALWIASTLLIVIAVITLIVILRKHAPPEPARLLPDADAFVYVNLKPLRRAGVIGKTIPISDEPEYKEFVSQTDFVFERDLDEAAVAVHVGATPGAPTRYSWVLTGTFQHQRAAAYFGRISRTIERYRDVEIYNIPLEGRTLRVALIGADIAAVSNTDNPAIIHGMIDRYKQLARPFGGPTLVRDYYKHVPLLSLAWTVVRVAPPREQDRPSNLFVLPGGFDLFFPAGTVIVGSVRYTGEAKLLAEAFTPGEDEARRITEQAGAFLALFRTAESAIQLHGPDEDVKAFFDSLRVEQSGRKAILQASVPPGFVKKLLSEPPASELPGLQGSENETPKQEPEKPAPTPKRKQQKH